IALVAVWFYLKRKKSREVGATTGAQSSAASGDLGLLIRDANNKLAAAGKSARVGSSPVFLLLGETGSAKTTTMVNAGLEAELLAGLVNQDGNVVPTRALNLWFSRDVVFVEAGGALTSDPQAWRNLAAKLRPSSSVLGSGQQSPRAVLVCLDCANFTKAGAH